MVDRVVKEETVEEKGIDAARAEADFKKMFNISPSPA